MRIVVVGAGKLGYSIAALLSKEQFDVIVIDHDESQLEAVKNTLDVLTIFANGASPITMNDPDIRGADILIAVTASDEVNMVACILAKKHGIAHTIARIRDMQFMGEAKEYLKENFDIDLMLNPELITAAEINRILMTPAALDVEDFAHGKIRLFETKVRRSSPLANIPLKDIAHRQEISVKYLENILASLSRAGLVEAIRGKGGGYRLSRPPEQYSVGEILRAIFCIFSMNSIDFDCLMW